MCGARRGKWWWWWWGGSVREPPPEKKQKTTKKKKQDVFGLHVNRMALTARCAKPLVFLRVNSVRNLVRGDLGTPPLPSLPIQHSPTPRCGGEESSTAAVGGRTDKTHVEERGSFVIPSLFFLVFWRRL